MLEQGVEIPGLAKWKGRWVRFRARLDLEESASTWPKLYFDLGSGYSELHPLLLPRCSGKAPQIDYLLKVPRGLRAATLHPGSDRLGVREVQALPLSKYAAAVAMLGPIAAADGAVSAAGCGLKALLDSLRGSRRAARRYPLVERYRDVRVRGGNSYAAWIREFEPSPEAYPALAQSRAAWPLAPRFSLLLRPHDAPQAELRAAVDSVLAQHYPAWELHVDGEPAPGLRELAARDRRLRVGAGAAAAPSGDFVAVLGGRGRLHPLALHFIAEAIVRHPGAGLFYTDEDSLDRHGCRHAPHFKCDFNYELLLSQNAIGQLAVYRRAQVEADFAREYDAALRAAEQLAPEQIVHLPRVLYHSSPAPQRAPSAAREAVAAHLARRGRKAAVMPAPHAADMNRVRFALPEPQPRVSIIVPTRDRADLLRTCLASIARRTTYANRELIVVDNGSREPAALDFARDPAFGAALCLRDDSPFNFSALNNRAVRRATGEFICLLNDDIEILTPDWIEEMLSFAAQPEVGAVGARLWYPDGRLQHGGVILGLGSVAEHAHRFLPRGQAGYFGRAALHQSFSAVTAACLLIRKSTFDEVGGLDERFAVAFNDTDFCLRVRQAGYRNVWTPYAEMIHHESASRGPDRTLEQHARNAAELQLMEQRWGKLLLNDPAYSANLTLERDDFSLAWPPRA